MKALAVLGTSSGAGKTWMATALCAWLRREGVRVAPFKAQNMSNNASVTPDGGEIARAQVVQAEACGLTPCVEMNPILLKPSGPMGSQVVLLGRAQPHQSGRDYYRDFERNWALVRDVLEGWKSRCDVLVLEGAGSPVELNLMDRDLVNLRPIRQLDGRWLLVGDIDRGGIYAQLAGTWNLLPAEDRARGLGAIVNRFRGDIGLFPNPADWLAPHASGLPVLGTVPFRPDLQPEEEDGLRAEDEDRGEGDTIAWVRLPHAANLSDCQPWWDDAGVRTRWTADPAVLGSARAIILPGTKNTLADLRWLRARGLDRAILAAAERGTLVIGVCGGYQLLGERLSDPSGVAGDVGDEPGLGLLPVRTEFRAPKIVRPVMAQCDGERWCAYEIHMGRTASTAEIEPLHIVEENGQPRAEGVRRGRVWGTYLHGWFESPRLRAKVAQAAGLVAHRPAARLWGEKRQDVYRAMADHIAEHLDLAPVRRYLGL
ncbi:cobyric acid synthase [Opitutus terrae]|uniref:Cobyric acid synthase n=1 Tax=Opitutus terrae (strain DSM 11246 / JCM 15787 / PB90-1) TaxID=452637 RepID=B1ZXH4_OPITP|nr:cobyric acid synthase [Opitutus terrae]ACB76969.1 cobyric acid synthase CobQ [Opitutus terrae PB90-1]